MKWVNDANERQLRQHVERLHRDIQDFDQRASQQQARLEREGRFSRSEPLYQRLTSIRDHLQGQLHEAQQELGRRTRVTPKSAGWSLRSLKPRRKTRDGRTSSVLGPKVASA